MTAYTPREVSPNERRFILFVDRLIIFIGDHWLLLIILSLFVFNGLPFLAPVLMRYGITGTAELIYRAYSFTCHQLSYRTFFFFGEQPAYTLAQLQSALGTHTDDPFFWRDVTGSAQLGYKMAWCERDAAIYTAILLASVLFGVARKWLRPLDWRVYLIVFVAPMALDGTTQLIGLRESDALLRVITGALFGAGSVWLIFPYLEEAMRDVQVQARAQYARGKAKEAALMQGK